MSFLNILNTQGTFYASAIIITAIILLIRYFNKKQINEKKIFYLFSEVIAIITLIPLFVFVASNGQKFIFGTEVKDLFYPISIMILYFGFISIKSIIKSIKQS